MRVCKFRCLLIVETVVFSVAFYKMITIGYCENNYNVPKATNEIDSTLAGRKGCFITDFTATIYGSLLQICLDEYMPKGSWVKDRWVSTASMKPACPSFNKYQQSDDISVALMNLMIGYMGDSTNQSDLRAWEEQFGCPRTDLDVASIFQRKKILTEVTSI